jgi:hypothetical protein
MTGCAYVTLYARVRNKRYTLAVRQLVAGDTTSDVLAEFLELLDGLDLCADSDSSLQKLTVRVISRTDHAPKTQM